MKFSQLLATIEQTHSILQNRAVAAINRSLTIRNWLIGFYIVEFEQNGEDRAQYGDKLIRNLSKQLQANGYKGFSFTNLNLFRQFYIIYPHIIQAVSEFLSSSIVQTLPEQFKAKFQETSSAALQNASTKEGIWQTLSAEFSGINSHIMENVQVAPDIILSHFSFSHIIELLPIQDPLKRVFYEIECMKGNWSIRELRRQINSLYYERSGLSANPQKLSAMVAGKAATLEPADIIKSIYTFEFLGLQARDVIEESNLETALLDHLQQFLLELGRGFCFEARQKRILIGDEYFFIDLVFYHRILKCHVLIELKVDEFSHYNAGQLNTYLNYYKKEIIEPHDNPPVGILMVTNKNTALVEYATAGIDNHLFVTKYLVQLPSKEQLLQFVQRELKNL